MKTTEPFKVLRNFGQNQHYNPWPKIFAGVSKTVNVSLLLLLLHGEYLVHTSSFFSNSQKERYYSPTSRRKVGKIFTINISSITKFVGYYGCNHTYASFLLTLLLLTVQFALHMSVNYTHRLFSKYCQIVIWGAISTPRVDNCKDRRLKLMKYDLAIHIIMSFDNEERILKLYVHF